MINKSNDYIKELTVSFITKQHVITVEFDLKLKINCSVLFVIPQWWINHWVHLCIFEFVWCNHGFLFSFPSFCFFIHDSSHQAHWHKSLCWMSLDYHCLLFYLNCSENTCHFCMSVVLNYLVIFQWPLVVV